VRKSGAHFIGWEDVAGQYAPVDKLLDDGRTIAVFARRTPAAQSRFLLTNPDGYSMAYDGLVAAVEKRRSHGWQAFGSYTLSRVSGLQANSGLNAAGAQVSTISPPPGPSGLSFGRDPNDLINASGRLANDRPHMLRAAGGVDLPRTGLTLSGNLQYFTGKPWAAAALVVLPQSPGGQRILLEPRGTRRLSSQTLLDLRLSRPVHIGRSGRADLLLDVLNALNDAAEESLRSDVQVTEQLATNPLFGQPNAFVDPRRVMIGIKLAFGR
jgi:hypothetical protein